jgi:uncharacterized protein (DUF362 family)
MQTQDNGKFRAYIDEVGTDLKATLQRGLEFIDWDKQLNKSSRVFVKPNFTFPYYREGVTTSPEFLKCLLEILRSRADTVIIGESNGGNHSFTAEEAFQGHDMYRIAEQLGVEVVNLSNLPAETIESRVLGKTVKVQLPRLLLEEIDCFVSVPVLKIHVMTTVTLSLKNSWGCYPDTMRCLHHQNLSYKLALIATLLKPKIVVVDGTYALNKHGPMYGDAVKKNLVLAADNTVVADALGATLMGFFPRRIEHLAVAERAGIGSLNLADIEINRDWQQYRMQFQIKKTLIDRASGLLFCSDALARLVMNSPLTSPIYKVARILRNPSEKEVASQMGKQKTLGPY